eukprot:COSAG04_NODE_1057_length_8525_cov_2.545336_1_plen_754_part_00
MEPGRLAVGGADEVGAADEEAGGGVDAELRGLCAALQMSAAERGGNDQVQLELAACLLEQMGSRASVAKATPPPTPGTPEPPTPPTPPAFSVASARTVRDSPQLQLQILASPAGSALRGLQAGPKQVAVRRSKERAASDAARKPALPRTAVKEAAKATPPAVAAAAAPTEPAATAGRQAFLEQEQRGLKQQGAAQKRRRNRRKRILKVREAARQEAEALEAHGDAAIKAGDHSAAVTAFSSALKLDFVDDRLRKLLATSLRAAQGRVAAETLAKALLVKAEAKMNMGEFGKAARVYESLLDSKGADSEFQERCQDGLRAARIGVDDNAREEARSYLGQGLHATEAKDFESAMDLLSTGLMVLESRDEELRCQLQGALDASVAAHSEETGRRATQTLEECRALIKAGGYETAIALLKSAQSVALSAALSAQLSAALASAQAAKPPANTRTPKVTDQRLESDEALEAQAAKEREAEAQRLAAEKRATAAEMARTKAAERAIISTTTLKGQIDQATARLAHPSAGKDAKDKRRKGERESGGRKETLVQPEESDDDDPDVDLEGCDRFLNISLVSTPILAQDWLTRKATGCRWMAELNAGPDDADELESMAAELLSEDSDGSTASSEAGDSAFDLDAMQAELEEGDDGEEEDEIRLELEDDAETEEEEREEREGGGSSSGEDEEEDDDGDGSVDDDLQALEAELLSGGGSPRPAEELIGGGLLALAAAAGRGHLGGRCKPGGGTAVEAERDCGGRRG